ncbi:M20/M25/M40 family metallo-hydrolase [Clostridia bacterium OttesenSCG-928-F22]|nr:M20/M25/M40 family metallo-hydrolase [Clostridia bacterium OttesenSCG-928-F22]
MVVVIVLAAVLLLLAAILLIRVLTFPRAPMEAEEKGADFCMEDGAVDRLIGAIRIKTVSSEEEYRQQDGPLEGYLAYLESTYPLVHETMSRHVMPDNSVYYVWQSKTQGNQPAAFMAHIDVVPAKEEQGWSVSPFEGIVKDGYLYGRGTMDMKGQMIAIFEAVEQLIKKGFEPQRDIYIILGSDEELSDNVGAANIAAKLAQEGVRFQFVLDEGATVKAGDAFYLEQDIAFIGVCEKGYIDLEIQAHQAGGHASAPPKNTAIGQVAAAVARLESKGMKSKWNAVVARMFASLAPYMALRDRLLFANLWLFKPLVLRRLRKEPSMAAMVTTTLAATMAYGSDAPNVLPGKAGVVCNLRVAPEETCAQAVKHVRDACSDGMRVEIIKQKEPSDISRLDGEVFEGIARSIRRTTGLKVVAPYPVVVGTDSRYFHEISECVYRFVPFLSAKEDISRIHTLDERLSLKSFEQGIAFFSDVMQTMC